MPYECNVLFRSVQRKRGKYETPCTNEALINVMLRSKMSDLRTIGTFYAFDSRVLTCGQTYIDWIDTNLYCI